jgi:hypothetical protein
MIQLKTTPQGYDVPIQAMQQFLYNQLLTTWSLQPADYTAYGRVYRNQTADGYTPEVFTGTGNDPNQPDYTDAFFDDTVKALSFFGVGESEKYNAGSTLTPVFLIFQVKVPDLKPAITHRADEEIRLDVQRLCTGRRYGLTMTGFETGIDNVFRDYSGWKKKDGIKFRDEHPWHCFRLNFQLLYNILDC